MLDIIEITINEFQNRGYGTEAIQTLINKIIHNSGLIAETEKQEDNQEQ